MKVIFCLLAIHFCFALNAQDENELLSIIEQNNQYPSLVFFTHIGGSGAIGRHATELEDAGIQGEDITSGLLLSVGALGKLSKRNSPYVYGFSFRRNRYDQKSFGVRTRDAGSAIQRDTVRTVFYSLNFNTVLRRYFGKRYRVKFFAEAQAGVAITGAKTRAVTGSIRRPLGVEMTNYSTTHFNWNWALGSYININKTTSFEALLRFSYSSSIEYLYGELIEVERLQNTNGAFREFAIAQFQEGPLCFAFLEIGFSKSL